jgi:hypothetical protein
MAVKGRRPKDWTGLRVGRLVVLRYFGRRVYARPHRSRLYLWACQCDCGNHLIRTSADLGRFSEDLGLACCRGCRTNARRVQGARKGSETRAANRQARASVAVRTYLEGRKTG